MNGVIDYLMIIAYFALMLAAGYWGYRRAKTADDFLVAGRRLGPVMYLGTLSATTLGGASTIGGVALGYQFGVSGMWLAAMIGLGAAALSLLFSSRLANLGIISFSDVLELRYRRAAGLFGALVMGVYEVMVVVTQVLAIGTLFDVVLGLSPTLAIVAAGGIVLLYSVAGGMWAITLTDIIQFVVMTVGIFFLLLPLALSQAGGLGGLRAELPASYFDLTAIGGQTILAYFLSFFLGIMIGQETWQRVFTARSGSVARWGGLLTGLYCVAYAFAGALVGCAARVLLPDLANPDNAFAQVATTVLPVGVQGLVLAAALAAVMSTASACLMAASTVLANGVYAHFFAGRETAGVALNRLIMLLVGVAALVLAVIVGDVVGALSVAFALLVSATFVPIVGALYWRRATGAGALAAIAAGSVVALAFIFTQGIHSNAAIIFGLLASLVAFVGVSLLTPPPSPRRLEEWERRMEEPAVARGGGLS
ncbi:Na+/solute symporter [Rubrobacter xylanophilus DSM 9941]|uniref:Na+/solute symporter n=1 Tax=Rubrobacter xylanophilus (strain DSM 9941 / JCM 11954 / NBRC 16129 / PRD-1) TaxID=266117 RepID=Q1AYI1_RUBXD|nr:sodium:solute symporter [Rubrobacter xylanophilus]ABG03547.1 Na+/solute symporter [Rubrobacter xylanophilus DSM 9941]